MTGDVRMSKAPAGVKWRATARCMTEHLDLDFFTADTAERYSCRAVCFTCPVRWNCLSEALNRPELIGIWGGVDEYEIRRALSVNAKGIPVERARKPRCPYCKSHLLELGQKTRKGTPVLCTECGIAWMMPLLKRPRKPVEVDEVHPNLLAQP